MYLLPVLIGSLDCLPVLWLTAQITFENRDINVTFVRASVSLEPSELSVRQRCSYFGDVRKEKFAFIEQFSLECHKTKFKVITLTNHNRRRQSNEPIRTQRKCMQLAPSAGKRVRPSHDWSWFYF